MVSAPDGRSRRIRSDDRAKRGKGAGGRRLSAPGNRERSDRPDFIGKHRLIHPAPETLIFAGAGFTKGGGIKDVTKGK